MADQPQPGHAGYDDDGYQWELAHEEAPDQVVFDTPGDVYVGIYQGHEVIHAPTKENADNWFIQLKWRDPGGLKVSNAGYELQDAYVEVTPQEDSPYPLTKDKIPPQTMTRNQYVKPVDTGQQSKMKSFRVDTATLSENSKKG